MFINHTNHPSAKWSKEQRAAAEAYGEIVDLPFPAIDATTTISDIKALAQRTAQDITSQNPAAVLVQGEFTYTYQLVQELTQQNIITLAATTERVVVDRTNPDGTAYKESYFNFVQFRPYD